MRIGTSEIYRAVESLPDVADSLAIDLEGAGEKQPMLLFVVPVAGRRLDEKMKAEILNKVQGGPLPEIRAGRGGGGPRDPPHPQW